MYCIDPYAVHLLDRLSLNNTTRAIGQLSSKSNSILIHFSQALFFWFFCSEFHIMFEIIWFQYLYIR